MADEEKQRIPIYAEYTGPGPLAYKLKTTIGRNDVCLSQDWAPEYSLRPKGRLVLNDAPGPNYTFGDNVTNKGKQDKPAYSLQSRPPIKGIEVTPGPGSYNANAVKAGTLSNEKNSPCINMGMRTRWPFKNEAPPSNTYTKQTTIGPGNQAYKGAPAWALKGRQDHGSVYHSRRKDNIPGPGSYATADPNSIKKRSGVYSMQGRTPEVNYNSVRHNPGPGAYNLFTPKKGGFSMGVRHSHFLTPLVIQEDVCPY